MAVLRLPLRSDQPHFDFTVSLDGTAYKFLFRWNTRGSVWYMSVSLDDDTPLFMGVAVVVNWPLGYRCRHPQKPKGLLMAFDDANTKKDPGLNDLGARVNVLYFDASEVAKLQAGAA